MFGDARLRLESFSKLALSCLFVASVSVLWVDHSNAQELGEYWNCLLYTSDAADE